MNRTGNLVTCQCCCNNHNQRGQNPSGRYRQQVGEDFGINQNAVNYPQNSGYRTNFSCGVNQRNDNLAAIDDQTLNTLTSLRQKACQFMRSESESSGSPSSVRNQQYQNQNVNPYRGSNVLRQANDLIDYAPQSEFLKKMKQQCQFLQNDQANVFSTLDNCEEFIPEECQDCIERTKRILTLGDQIRCNRARSPPPEGPVEAAARECCPCKQQMRGLNGLGENQMRPRDIQSMYENQRLQKEARMMGKSNLERIVEEGGDKILQNCVRYPGEEGISEKKSEHMSRSKKVVKCRGGRRKRKSESFDTCESEEEVEPNLKKPHENSCERCWKFASPSRSPVNKPDQRYDPNFRRGHSSVDLKKERGDGDLEIDGDQVPSFKNLQSVVSRDKGPSQLQPSQTAQPNQRKIQLGSQKPNVIQQECENNFRQNESFTKVKELGYNYVCPRSPERSPPKMQSSESGRKSPTSPGILQSDTGQKPRPKGFTTGQTTLKTEDLPSYLLDVSDYCNLCQKPKQKGIQSEADRRPGTVSGNRTERISGENGSPNSNPPCSPLKAGTPNTVNRPGPSSRGSSPPQQGSRPKTSTGASPKSKSPKTPTDLSLSFVSPGSDATTYADVVLNKATSPCSPKKSPQGESRKKRSKSPPPKSSSRSGKSPRKGSKSPPKGSPKKVQSSTDCVENLPPHCEGRPQTVLEPTSERRGLPSLGRVDVDDDYQGGHPFMECCCPPRAPFIRSPNANPSHLICCHCHWEKNRKNQPQSKQLSSAYQSNVPPNHRPDCQDNEMSERQFVNEPSPRHNSPPNKCYIPPEDLEMECPYRAFQLEKMAANDTSWEADYQELKELCMNNPDFQFATSFEENKPPCKGKKEQPRPSGYVPTKYALFYMTQSKLDKGDEVEVLVEELTQACPNGTERATKDITEKMKRIMECPSDSMALRFQKGVSESSRTPRSSRILYF